MRSNSSKTIHAVERNDVSLFVYFGFMFFPVRVHSGQRSIHWEGHEWQGIGDVLRQDATSKSSILSSQTSDRGRMSATLPISKKIREVLSEEYYRDRKMQWMVCALDANDGVARRLYINEGRIVSYRRVDDNVTFTAESEFLDSLHERDARHKRKVHAIRQRFKSDMVDTIVSGGPGWIVTLAGMIEGAVGSVVDLMEIVIRGRNWRIAKQRWAARKRTYWFRTEPRIPGVRLRRNGYKMRGDTLDEAKSGLYELVANRVWDIPPGFVCMVIYLNDQPLEFLNLDKLRQNDDPKRYEKTSSMRAWPP